MLRYGIVGAGFVSAFHLRALESVRGVEVAGITSRTPPVELAESARARGLGEARVFDSVTQMLPHVDVVAVFVSNDARLAVMEDVAVGGAHLRGLIIEKPLGRNLAEARRVVELANGLGVPTAYFENQIHMKAITNARAQLEATARAMGPLVLARSGEEHAGPHNAWFWDPTRQGGGVLSDMGCHSIAVGWYLLTPPGKGVRHLVPETVSAEVGLLKWGQPRWRAVLLDEHGVDYTKTPAEDFATGIITYRESSAWPGVDFLCSASDVWWGKVGGGAGWSFVDVQAQAAFACDSPWWFDWHDFLMQRIRYHPNGYYETIAYQ